LKEVTLTPEEVQMMVRRVLQESGLSRALIARDSGLSWSALNLWIARKRTPQPESVRQLATGLRSRAAKLEALAAELENAAGEG
jgi:hypothetical protein